MSLSPNDAGGGGNATGSGRTKVALKPGHSLLDWIKFCAKSKDLPGTGGRLLTVTEEELSKHNKTEDCWIVIQGRVYNVTPYMNFHPGGVDELNRGAGIDATDLFNEVHRWVNFESMLAKCLVGKYLGSSPTKATSANQKASKPKLTKMSSSLSVPLLGPQPKLPSSTSETTSLSIPGKASSAPPSPSNRTFQKYVLQAKEPISHDSSLFTFAIENKQSGAHPTIDVGHHVTLKLMAGGRDVLRDYTPVPPNLLHRNNNDSPSAHSSELLAFMIKIYPDGPFTSQLDKLTIGDTVDISGPVNIDFNTVEMLKDKSLLVLLAAGTGITPMLSLINWVLTSESESSPGKFQICLIFFNKRQRDILWRSKLDALAQSHTSSFRVVHVLSQEDNQWPGLTGRFTKDLLLKSLSSPPNSTATDSNPHPWPHAFFCVCGPNEFTWSVLECLSDTGYVEKRDVFAFIS